jgi:hypothetical protein
MIQTIMEKITITSKTKIDEIKHIRDYCKQRYGNPGGLTECKHLVDEIQARQESELEGRIMLDIQSANYGALIRMANAIQAKLDGTSPIT